jgi:hypothetical protein
VSAIIAPLKRLFKGNLPLYFAERRQVLAPVIELRGARIGVVRHVLGRFQRTAVMQEYRYRHDEANPRFRKSAAGFAQSNSCPASCHCLLSHRLPRLLRSILGRGAWFMSPDLVVPSNIPWQDLKGEVLEEFVYWLLDDLGAKDLEWRRGGAQATSADGSRDIEVLFHFPTPDGMVDLQRWWVQVKGRTKTVEPQAVRDTLTAAANRSDIDSLAIVTNTQFSNPTRDWVAQWQTRFPRPRIRLWDRANLESLVTKHPSVVARLTPEALSPQGRLEVLRAQFWNQSYFARPEDLDALWPVRDSLEWSSEALLAVVAGELVNGDVRARTWLGTVDQRLLAGVLGTFLLNFIYLSFRSERFGVKAERITELGAYVVSIGIRRLKSATVVALLKKVWDGTEGESIPSKARAYMASVVLEELRAQLGDACSKDCTRISGDTQTEAPASIGENYWHRFSSTPSFAAPGPQRSVTIEKLDEPCNVGFVLGRERGCPLFRRQEQNATKLVKIFHQVIENRATPLTVAQV